MRDLEPAKIFYRNILDMEIATERDFGVFFRFNDDHHDIAVFKVDKDATSPEKTRLVWPRLVWPMPP